MTPPQNKFENPYKGLPPNELTRLQTYVSKADHDHLFIELHSGQGSVTTTVNTLFSKLIESLKRYGIIDTATQRLDYEQFIADFTIVLPKRHRLSGVPAKRAAKKGHDESR